MTFYQRLQGSFTCHWDPITWDRHYSDHNHHYSDHTSHYASLRPRTEQGLTVNLNISEVFNFKCLPFSVFFKVAVNQSLISST